MSQGSDQTQAQTDVNAEDLLELKPSDGKGEGWFAREDIGAGTCVLVEPSFIRAPLSGTFTASENRYVLYELAKKNKQDQENYRTLYAFASKSLRYSPEWKQFSRDQKADLARWHCNCFGVYGVGIQISKFNHSCVPNTEHHRSRSNKEIVCYTTDFVRKGEELFISYDVDFNFQKAAERRTRTSKVWGFSCDCLACGKELVERQLDDEKRLELGELHALLRSYRRGRPVGFGLGLNDLILVGERAAKLQRDLGFLGVFYEDWCRDISDLYSLQSNAKKALHYAQACKNAVGTRLGKSTGEYEDAERHWKRCKEAVDRSEENV